MTNLFQIKGKTEARSLHILVVMILVHIISGRWRTSYPKARCPSAHTEES